MAFNFSATQLEHSPKPEHTASPMEAHWSTTRFRRSKFAAVATSHVKKLKFR
jgi:hypothetical protein